MKKKFSIFLVIIISAILMYLFMYIHTLLDLKHDASFKFSSVKSLSFHKKYSNIFHHLRNLKKKDRSNFNEYLYTEINKFEPGQNNILFQGDATVQQMIDPYDNNFQGLEFVKNFAKENNLGFINAGISSFSPTLMKLQLEILEKDFDIKPNMIVAYIDQTDIGDENCKYKDKKIFKENKVVSIKGDNYSGKQYDYERIYGKSNILLTEKFKLTRAFKLLNFKIKYNYIKFRNKNLEKFNRILKDGYSGRKLRNCFVPKIQSYLADSTDDEIKYFEKTVIDYVNYIEQNDNIKKIFFVTFPHKNHLSEFKESSEMYKHNVSDIIEKLIKDKKKIKHLNFTKLIKKKQIFFKKENYLKDDPVSHLSSKFYRDTFIKDVTKYIFKNLN
jgi:hypothetical protein